MSEKESLTAALSYQKLKEEVVPQMRKFLEMQMASDEPLRALIANLRAEVRYGTRPEQPLRWAEKPQASILLAKVQARRFVDAAMCTQIFTGEAPWRTFGSSIDGPRDVVAFFEAFKIVLDEPYFADFYGRYGRAEQAEEFAGRGARSFARLVIVSPGYNNYAADAGLPEFYLDADEQALFDLHRSGREKAKVFDWWEGQQAELLRKRGYTSGEIAEELMTNLVVVGQLRSEREEVIRGSTAGPSTPDEREGETMRERVENNRVMFEIRFPEDSPERSVKIALNEKNPFEKSVVSKIITMLLEVEDRRP